MIYATPCSPRSSIRGRLGGTSWPSSSAALHIPSTYTAAHYTGRSARRSCAGHDAGISTRPGYAMKRGARYPAWARWARDSRPAGQGLLSTIWAEWPEVLDDFRDAVFTPLIHSGTPRRDIVALLKRRDPRPVDMPRGSLHRQVRAQIVRWARRWHLNAPGIRDEAWRTLSWWVRSARDSRPAGQGLLSTIWAEWPEVLDDLRDAVFTPLIHSGTPRGDIVALLKRRAPHPVDIHRGSLHRQVRAQIVRWARRWHLNAPGIRDEAWRTLSWWARWARDSRPAGRAFGWAPLVSTTPRSIAPPTPPALDRHEQLVQMPDVTHPATSASERARIVGPEGLAPLSDRFGGHGDPAFREEIFDIAKAQTKAVGEPDRVTDDLGRKAVAAIAWRRAHHGPRLRATGST